MNQRIKELAWEHGFIHEWQSQWVQQDKLQSLEKFAELIVRECAELAYDGPNGILEHFGLRAD